MSKRRIVVFDKSSSVISVELSYRRMAGSCATRAVHDWMLAIIVGMTRTFPQLALTLAACLALTLSTRAQEGPNSEEASRIRESITVLNEVMATSDTAIPASITMKAEGIAIFPGTLKGGFIFGGMRGRGILSARNEDGWSAPTFMTLTGGSIGLQIGGEATDLVLVIMNRRGLEQFVRNQFKFGADAAVAAGTGWARRAGEHRPSNARGDPQLLALQRPVRRGDGQRQHRARRSRRKRALLWQAAHRTSARPRQSHRRILHTGTGVDSDAEPLHHALSPAGHRASPLQRRHRFRRWSRAAASVPSTLTRAKFLSLPSTSVHGAIFVLVRSTMSLTATV